MLVLEDTVKSYSGKPGCMCGCNGNYTTSAQSRRSAITRLMKAEFRVQDFNYKMPPEDRIAGCIYSETETRNRVLYVTTSGLKKLKEQFPDLVDQD